MKLKLIKGLSNAQNFELKNGENTVGRVPPCDIVIASAGVSKLHAKLTVQGDQCVLTDQGSSNGTFVNGLKVRDRILRPGDKIAFHNVIFELTKGSENFNAAISGPSHAQPWSGNVAYQQDVFGANAGLPGQFNQQAQNQLQAANASAAPVPQGEPQTFIDLLKRYVDSVVLPGIYKISEIYPLRNVLGAFIFLFAFLVTGLATIPMNQMSQEGIQKEAQRRALTIARQLAGASERNLTTTGEGTIRTDFAENEDGVQTAIVVSKDDGHIIAPISRAQSYTNDEFVARARRVNDEFVIQINATTIGVSEPIHVFSPEVGQSVVTAYAVVIYKMDSLDWSATIGLFARVLLIALTLGAVLYFVMYKVIIHPILEATSQVDEALRGERESVAIKTDFDIFGKFIDNVNAALSRMGHGNGHSPALVVDRSLEAGNMVRIISDPAFALNGGGQFVQVNGAFEDLTGMRLLTLQGQNLDILQDQALKLNIEDLIQQGKNQMGQIVTSQLDISGLSYEIDVMVSPDAETSGSFNYVFGTIKKRGSS